MPTLRSDEELMAAYVGGDAQAFDELFRRYAPLVYRLMRRGYRSEHDAQDLTQQTFLQIHRARRDYKAPRPVRPWIVTIARNLLRERMRRERRRPAELSLVSEPRAADPGQEALERSEILAGALEQLPGSLRKVIEERWKGQKSYAQIGREMGISSAAARVRAHRGYRALRRLLEDRGLLPP